MNKDDLKLVYVLKIGYDSKQQGLYEFIFSKDPSVIPTDELGWNEIPANGVAQPPEEKDIDLILSLKTNKIDFICLHESYDRSYMDGYYTIHCLAYENVESNNSDSIFGEETGLLVFHFGMKLKEVKDHFFSRDLQLKEVEVNKTTPVVTATEEEEEETEEDELQF